MSSAIQRAGQLEAAGLRLRRQRLADPALGPHARRPLGVVADLHAVDRRDPGHAGLTGPVVGLCDLGVFGGQPASDLREDASIAGADLRRQRRGRMPALDPVRPGAGGALDRRGAGAVSRTRRRVGVAESGNCAVNAVEVAHPLALLYSARRADRGQGHAG